MRDFGHMRTVCEEHKICALSFLFHFKTRPVAYKRRPHAPHPLHAVVNVALRPIHQRSQCIVTRRTCSVYDGLGSTVRLISTDYY